MRSLRYLRWVDCIAMAGSATAFGIAHLLGEGAFVGTLGLFEWRWRDRLAAH